MQRQSRRLQGKESEFLLDSLGQPIRGRDGQYVQREEAAKPEAPRTDLFDDSKEFSFSESEQDSPGDEVFELVPEGDPLDHGTGVVLVAGVAEPGH